VAVRVQSRSDFPDFNDTNKLGDGAQKVEKLGKPHRHL